MLVHDGAHALGGEHKIYHYDNGYGASVIRTDFSYGNNSGLWEVAVLSVDSQGVWGLCYDSGLTDDVLGYLSDENVEDLLTKIERLPSSANVSTQQETN